MASPGQASDPFPVDLKDFNITLRKEIGRGGFSTVWRASSPEYVFTLAVKFLDDSRYKDLSPIEEAIREFRSTQELRSAFIVPVERSLRLTGKPGGDRYPIALVMQHHVPSLDQLIADLRKHGLRLHPDRVAEFGRNLLHALDAIHRRGLVHRDVKPSNVLIKLPDDQYYYEDQPLPPCHALLSDYGTAARVDRDPLFQLYQDRWKAPELFEDPGASDPKPVQGRRPHPSEDMFALGLMLRLLAEVVDGSPDWLVSVAEDLTHPDPVQRPTADQPILRERLSPDYEKRQVIDSGGWDPEAHKDFTGREFIFAAFDQWCRECAALRRGGYFVVEADAGVGKTALATAWVRRRGLHPAYFFVLQGRTRTRAMATVLFKALCRRFRIDRDAPAEDEFAAGWEALFDQIRERLDATAPLLLIVDGLDEAIDPEKAVELLPRPPLPAGLFVVITTRPPISGRDHLAALRIHPTHARFKGLHGDSPENLADLARFLQKELAPHLQPAAAEKLAQDVGGTFELAMDFLDDIRAGRSTVEQALENAEQIKHLPASAKSSVRYQESWERIKHQVPDRRDQAALVDFLCLLAAAQTALGEKTQALPILEWNLTDLDWAKRMLRWLIREREDRLHGIAESFLQLKHKSVNVFLLSREYNGPARYGLAQTHARIARHYLNIAATDGWQSVDSYGRAFVLRHLCEADDSALLQKAADLLEDLRFLQATITRPPGKEDGVRG